MTSERSALLEATQAYVWIWLPGASDPVVCGVLDDTGGQIAFAYARSYLERDDAVAIFEPELALRRGEQFSADGQRLPLCIDDAMPDSWGRRIVNERLGEPTAELGELTYLLASGSDRIGALDFQASPDRYEPRHADHPTLDDLATAAARIDAGEPLPAPLADALLRGTSIGGARPKALIDGAGSGRARIAKFSSRTDTYPVVQAEYVAMELARRAGLDVAGVELSRAAGRYALLVDRFDRHPDGTRRRVVSALTVLGLSTFPGGRYATYPAIADAVRERFDDPEATLRELFGRITFNVLCSNTDDHGRNHAALVGDGTTLILSPAYDICPQSRAGGEAQQAMAYDRHGTRWAQLTAVVDAAEIYHLDRAEAVEIVEHQIATINDDWDEVCDLAELTAAERDALRGRQFLHPYALDGWPTATRA